jgi:glycosyltransferase involved in cell wall biosynthesis
MGESHREVANAFPGQLIIEPMVGYEGPMRESFWATESYGWLYNRYASLGIKDHRQFDTVIPPFQRASDFELGEDQGYALFLGRHSLRKGPHVASDIAAAAGLPLLTAGNGVLRQEGNDIICTDGTVIKNAAYLGPKNPAERKDLLAHASVVITPTLYIEPGANVAVEALLSGVGVVAPDGGGVFTDTLPREWRYRSLKQAVAAVEAAAGARGSALREHALSKYSMEACAPLYAEWLARLRTLFGDGWYQL